MATTTRETHTFDLLGSMVTIYRPTHTQLMALAKQTRPGDDGEAALRAVLNVDLVVSSLFVHQAEWDAVERSMMTGELDDETYAEFLAQVVGHFYPAEKATPPRKTAARRRR